MDSDDDDEKIPPPPPLPPILNDQDYDFPIKEISPPTPPPIDYYRLDNKFNKDKFSFRDYPEYATPAYLRRVDRSSIPLKIGDEIEIESCSSDNPILAKITQIDRKINRIQIAFKLDGKSQTMDMHIKDIFPEFF